MGENLEPLLCIVLRGVHHYTSIDQEYKNCKHSKFHITNYCFHIRSLAEVAAAMPAWTYSEKNLKKFQFEALNDFLDLFKKLVKSRLAKEVSETQELKLKLEQSTEELSSYIEILKKVAPEVYEGPHQSKIRKKDSLYENTKIWTSKFLHADECSIYSPIMFKEPILYDNHFFKQIEEMALFWKKDFHAQMYFSYQKFPHILERIGNLPFDIKTNPYDN